MRDVAIDHAPRVRRISGSKTFRSPPQKDFCNKICHFRTYALRQLRPYWMTSAVRASSMCGTSIPSDLAV